MQMMESRLFDGRHDLTLFGIAQYPNVDTSRLSGSPWSALANALDAIVQRKLDNIAGSLFAVPLLFGLGIAWLLIIKDSLVDRWMGWSREVWLQAVRTAKARTGHPHLLIAGRPDTSRHRYRMLAVVYVMSGCAVYLLFLLSPVWAGWVLGPAAVITLFLPLFIAPISLLSRWSLSCRFPVLATVLAVLAVVGVAFDQHYVRALEGSSHSGQNPESGRADAGPAVDKRVDVSVALQAWREQAVTRHCGSAAACPADTALPVVIVAAAGGGLRAAYWTADVLATLHDKSEGKFSKSLFAISGVSGGALGATVYRALLTRAEKIAEAEKDGKEMPFAECERDPQDPKRRLLAPCARAVLGRDSLAPALGSMLFTDLVHRAVPLPAASEWLGVSSVSGWLRDRDRAAALEEAWEES